MAKRVQTNRNTARLGQLSLVGNSEFRRHSLTAESDANAFRKVFEGGMFYRLGILKRYRSHMDLVILLVVLHRMVQNTDEALSFINEILDQEIPYAQGKKFILRKKEGVISQYSLEYIRHRY